MKIIAHYLSLTILLASCASVSRNDVPKNLYGEWILRESRCEDMVIKSSVEQKVIIYEGHLNISVKQGDCQFANTMPYTASGNVITAVGPRELWCSNKGCPANVTLINQLGSKDSMTLECPMYKKGEKADFYFRLEGDRLVQFSKKSPDDCDLTYSKR